MIRATVTAPQASWTNPSPVNFPTGFQRLAHIPPAAIGPQFAGQLGQRKEGGDTRAFIAVAALVGVGGAVLLMMHGTKEPAKREFRGDSSRREKFGQCSTHCSGGADFKGCMSDCASS